MKSSIWFIFSLLLLAACGRGEEAAPAVSPSAAQGGGEVAAEPSAAPPSKAPSQAEPAADKAPDAPAVPRVADMPQVDHQGLKARVAADGGKVTMVAAWATWCAPCIEEMPTLAAFYNKHQHEGLKVIGLCMDDRTPMKDKIQEVLDRIKVPFPMVTIKEEGQDAFYKAVDPSWEGDLPGTLVFNDKGERVAFFKEALTEEVLQREVAPLLTKK